MHKYNTRLELDTLMMPGGIRERFGYDQDGQLTSNAIANGSSTSVPYRFPDAMLRQTAMTYDARGKILTSTNSVGVRDSHTAK